MASRANEIAEELNRLGADAWTAEDQANLVDFLGEYHYNSKDTDSDNEDEFSSDEADSVSEETALPTAVAAGCEDVPSAAAGETIVNDTDEFDRGTMEVDAHSDVEMPMDMDLSIGADVSVISDQGNTSCSADDSVLIQTTEESIIRAINEGEVEFDLRAEDMDEFTATSQFQQSGCSCAMGPNESPCCRVFTVSHYREYRSQCLEMTRDQLDILILGQLAALTHTSTMCVRSTQYHHSPQQRQRQYAQLHHQQLRVCSKTFAFLHTVGKKKLNAIKQHFHDNGVIPRVHGNTGRLPHNTMALSDVRTVTNFIINYAEANGVILPGRVPGYKNTDLQLLPSSTTKRQVWLLYTSTCSASNTRATCYSAFCSLWLKLLPQVVITKPLTDLCDVCHKHSSLLVKSGNRSEEEKSQVIREAEEHLLRASKERSSYIARRKNARDTAQDFYTHGLPSPGRTVVPPLTGPAVALYSFDFAQQVHYPNDPWQPGPIYFKTPRKCAIFGVNNESIPCQVNYLIDEASATGKGGNVVSSMLHYNFTKYGLGEKECFLYADNCVGQNKNNIVVQYLVWRVLSGLHQTIHLCFLLVGHTKFAPDACFGVFKRKYRRTKVSCLNDVKQVAEESAVVNLCQLVGTQSGEVIVPTYNWSEFLKGKMKKVIGIKKLHQITITADLDDGVKVLVKEYTDSEARAIKILADRNWRPTGDLPAQIQPSGLDAARQWYLYNEIREYCSEDTQDCVCPLPRISPTSNALPADDHDSILDEEVDEIEERSPVRTHHRVCGICHMPGHNRRTCPSVN